MSEAEKIAELGARVEVLTEAVVSMLEWRVSSSGVRQGPQVSLAGQDETRKILARLQTQPLSWGEGEQAFSGFTPTSDDRVQCDECGALVSRDEASIRAHGSH